MKKFLKAVLEAAGWFALFMGIQFLVTLAGILILMGNQVYHQGTALFENIETFHGILMGLLMKHMTLLVLVSNLLTILIFWAFFSLRHRKMGNEIGLQRTTGRNLTLSVIFGTGMCFFMDLLTAVLPVPEQVMEEFETQHGMLWFGDVGITFLSVALLGPVSEEICFRGLCYGRLKKAMPPWAAGLISSVFFGLAHGDPVWFLVGFVAGLSLCWIYEITGSLLCAMIVHVTNNAISSMTAYFPVSDSFHRILVLSSVVVTLVSGILLYRGRRFPNVQEEQL